MNQISQTMIACPLGSYMVKVKRPSQTYGMHSSTDFLPQAVPSIEFLMAVNSKHAHIFGSPCTRSPKQWILHFQDASILLGISQQAISILSSIGSASWQEVLGTN